MPFKIVAEQSRFRVTTASNGLPIAEVVRWGTMYYTVCCSLCGCIHEVGQVVKPGATFTPKCPLKTKYPKVYAAWQKAHPAVSAHSEIVLKLREVELMPDETIISTPTEPEKRAA